MSYYNKKYFFSYSLIIFLLIIAAVLTFSSDKELDKESYELVEQDAKEANIPVETKIKMVTHYVVGDDLTETKTEIIQSIQDIEEKYPQWTITSVKEDEILIERFVEDISPDCKGGAYFSLSPEGYLTLYKGNSDEKKVIETFFRIDVKSLESGLPKEPVEQLYQGIPVKDLAEFNSVLSTFSEFSVE